MRRSTVVSESILTPEQRLMVRLQRENVIEECDFTESSDEIKDYYTPQALAKLRSRLQGFQNREISQLDAMLLKGFYTSNRSELGLAPLIKEKLGDGSLSNRSAKVSVLSEENQIPNERE